MSQDIVIKAGTSLDHVFYNRNRLVIRPDPEVMWLDLRLVSPKVELEVLVRSQWAVLWGILFEQPQLLSLTSVPSSNDLVQKLHLEIRPKGVS